MKLSMAADTRHVGKLLGQSASKCFKLAFPNSPNLQIQPIGCPKAPSVSLESSVKGIQLRIDILKEELSLPSKPIKKSDIYASGQQNHNVEKGNRRNSYGETINSYINDGFEDFDLFAPPPTVIKKVIKKQPEPGKPDTSTRPKTPSTSSNQPSSYPLGARRSIGAQLRAAASVHDEKPKPSPTRVEAGGAWDEEPSTSYLKSLPMGEWERQAKALLRRKRQAELLSKKSEKTFEEQLGLDLSEDSMGHMSPARGPAPYGVPRPNGHSRMAFPYEAPKPKRPAGPPQAHGNWGRGQAQGPVQPAAAAAAGGVPAHWLKGHDDDDDDSDDEKLGAENEETLEELVKAHPHCSELVSYLRGLGMTESAFERIMKRHSQCLLTNAVLARERVEYLLSVGVKRANLCKLIVRHPQILEYRVEQMMKVRVRFLLSLGVPPAAIGGILTKSPTILECSVDRALQPRVRFLQVSSRRLPSAPPASVDFHVSAHASIRFRICVGIWGCICTTVSISICILFRACKLSRPGLMTITIVWQVMSEFGQTRVRSRSIEDSLRPRIEFLRDEVGIPFAALAQIVVRKGAQQALTGAARSTRRERRSEAAVETIRKGPGGAGRGWFGLSEACDTCQCLRIQGGWHAKNIVDDTVVAPVNRAPACCSSSSSQHAASVLLRMATPTRCRAPTKYPLRPSSTWHTRITGASSVSSREAGGGLKGKQPCGDEGATARLNPVPGKDKGNE
eukprot:jgi/Mesen1/1099/ME000123S00275